MAHGPHHMQHCLRPLECLSKIIKNRSLDKDSNQVQAHSPRHCLGSNRERMLPSTPGTESTRRKYNCRLSTLDYSALSNGSKWSSLRREIDILEFPSRTPKSNPECIGEIISKKSSKFESVDQETPHMARC